MANDSGWTVSMVPLSVCFGCWGPSCPSGSGTFTGAGAGSLGSVEVVCCNVESALLAADISGMTTVSRHSSQRMDWPTGSGQQTRLAEGTGKDDSRACWSDRSANYACGSRGGISLGERNSGHFHRLSALRAFSAFTRIAVTGSQFCSATWARVMQGCSRVRLRHFAVLPDREVRVT